MLYPLSRQMQDIMQVALFSLTLVTVTLAAVIDIYKSRIPNLITLPALGSALILQYFSAGWPGLLSGVLGMLAACSLFFLLWLLGGMGAGDVKLIGAVGALLGLRQLMTAFVLIAIVGAFLAALYILKSRAVQQTLANLAKFPAHIAQRLKGGHFDPSSSRLTLQSPTAIKFPYGVPIAVGTMLSFLVS